MCWVELFFPTLCFYHVKAILNTIISGSFLYLLQYEWSRRKGRRSTSKTRYDPYLNHPKFLQRILFFFHSQKRRKFLSSHFHFIPFVKRLSNVHLHCWISQELLLLILPAGHIPLSLSLSTFLPLHFTASKEFLRKKWERRGRGRIEDRDQGQNGWGRWPVSFTPGI